MKPLILCTGPHYVGTRAWIAAIWRQHARV